VGAEKEFVDHLTEQVIPDFVAWQESNETKVPD
jgi:hypothetical protein